MSSSTGIPLLHLADSQEDDGIVPHNPEMFEDDDSLAAEGDRVACQDVSRELVIERIEDIILTQSILEPLDERMAPAVKHPHKTFLHNRHCRSLTSMFLVADFCHELLIGNRTTTIREVYYHFVTHFRNQAECDRAIWDLATTLQVPRSSLGLAASPKGWCCGSLELYDRETGGLMWNGQFLDVHGMPITTSLLQADVQSTGARCILVIEKEGVYIRLSEDKLFQYYPCILVTGKGFPDIATRQWVQHLHRVLKIPVYGLCDCNPYGISVLHTYHYGQDSSTLCEMPIVEGRHVSKGAFQIQWLGLRPSQLKELELPPSVFQQMTDLDKKRLESLRHDGHLFHQQGNSDLRRQELDELLLHGRKVELEALNWMGMDFLCRWVYNKLELHEKESASGLIGAKSRIII